jgi:hypothetical protein
MLIPFASAVECEIRMTPRSHSEQGVASQLVADDWAVDALAKDKQLYYIVAGNKTALLVAFGDSRATKAWQRHVLNPAAPADVDAISETVAAVFDALAAYGPTGVSLLNLAAADVQGEHLAATLRASYRLRDKVPGWKDALIVADEALRRNGMDPDDALVGLKK